MGGISGANRKLGWECPGECFDAPHYQATHGNNDPAVLSQVRQKLFPDQMFASLVQCSLATMAVKYARHFGDGEL